MDLKIVALNNVHEALNAKMVPFAGFNMPVRYSSDKEEHMAVREQAGLFDVSHMGEFYVRGKGALPLLQFVTTNDVSVLKPGKIQYTCLPNGEGGIVDDLLIYMLGDDDYLLVVNASNIEKDWNWLVKNNTFGAELVNVSDQFSLLALQGPNAEAILQKLTEYPLNEMSYYTFDFVELSGLGKVFVSATGYTGAGGFEIMIDNSKVVQLWVKLFEAGESLGLKPIGLGARDTLRLEKGYCLYGNDIDDSTSPIEAGLGWVTKFSKDFIDKEKMQTLKTSGVSKKLVAFRMIEKGIPRSHYEILSSDDQIIGEVTSGTISPVLNQGIGMGYVHVEFAKPGTIIKIQIRKNLLEAEVVKLPFV